MRSYVHKKAGGYIHSKLKTASKSVYICTPYIDQKYVDELVSLTIRNVLVKLISGSRQSNFNLKEYLHSCAIDYRYFQHVITPKRDFVHAKIFIIDEKYAVDGSANLTKNGLWEQVNYIHVYDETEEVQKVIGDFNKIWRYNKKYLSDSEETAQFSYAKQSSQYNQLK